MKNIELKILVNNFKKIKFLLKRIEAENIGKIYQKDIYYYCKNRRLKIRNIDNKKYELISYIRPNKTNSKISTYEIFNINSKKIKLIKSLMEKKFTQRNIVEKKRDLWIWRNTRVHLDRVKELGYFMELETIVGNRHLEEAKAEFDNIFKLLDLKKYKKIANSYSDLLSEKIRIYPEKVIKFDKSILVEIFNRISELV